MIFGGGPWSEGSWSSTPGTRTFFSAETGVFTLTGLVARLLYNRLMAAAKGTFTLTGIAAVFLYNRAAKALTGVFTVSGQDARLMWARIFPVDAGSFVLTGISQILRFIRRSPRAIIVGEENRALSVTALPATRVAPEDRRIQVVAEQRVIVVHKDKDDL